MTAELMNLRTNSEFSILGLTTKGNFINYEL